MTYQPTTNAAVAAGSAPESDEEGLTANDSDKDDGSDGDDGSSVVSGDTAGSRTDAELESGNIAAVAARRTKTPSP